MSQLVSANLADNFAPLGEVTVSTSAEITATVAAANRAKKIWKELGAAQRVAAQIESGTVEINTSVR